MAALSRAPQVEVSAGVLPALRTGAPGLPSREADDREVIGAGASMSDVQFLEAARQWWRCDAGTVTSAGVLAVAVAGWVVGVLAVRGVQETRAWKVGEVRHSFAADLVGRVGTPDESGSYRVMTSRPALAEPAARLLGARVQGAVSGGPIAYLSAGCRRAASGHRRIPAGLWMRTHRRSGRAAVLEISSWTCG